MIKRKTMMSIAVLLLLGGGVLGTKALFKDTEEATNDLIITTGSLELEVDNESPWKIVSEDSTEISNIADTNGFENVRPGDKFQKTIKISNVGSLSQILTIKEPKTINSEDNRNVFEVESDALQTIHNKELQPNKSKTISITVSTKPELMEKGKHETLNVDFSKIISPIIIEANQINAK